MAAMEADKRLDYFLNAPTDGAPKYALQEVAGHFLLLFLKKFRSGAPSCDENSPRPAAHSAGQKQSGGLFLGRGRVLNGAPGVEHKKGAVLLRHSLTGRTYVSRRRGASNARHAKRNGAVQV